MTRSYCILAALIGMMLAGNLQNVWAQVPARISYQGLMLDEPGTALADGTYRVTFRLYTEQNDVGSALWSETQTVAVEGGLLSTMIGSEKALDLPFDQPYFLTVQIEGQPESERMALSAAAYALLARNVPDSTVVRSISGLRDQVELVAGPGISIQQRDNQLVISAAGQEGLKGYGPQEPLPKKAAGPLTDEEDMARLADLLASLGPGGSNSGLDAAYDAGRIITPDDGRVLIDGPGGTPPPVTFEVRNSDILFNNDLGQSSAFRFLVGGVSTTQVWKLELVGGTTGASGLLRFTNATSGRVPFQINKSATNNLVSLEGSALKIRDTSGAVKVTIDSDVGGDGRVITEELEITGGSDLSENFDVTGNFGVDTPLPGMVVSIDPSSPGRLTISGTPYDRMVAGVVSGAGGIETGLLMGQDGTVADGALPVALTGRIYVYVDAAYGAIEPGDLLTSSATPGHAMKVSDHERSQGAILGKAMTGLSEGRGLVLMLVSLQ